MTLLPSINKNWFLLITCIFTHNYESCENGKLNIPWFILMPCMMLTHLLIRKDKNMKPWFLAILNMHEHRDESTSREELLAPMIPRFQACVLWINHDQNLWVLRWGDPVSFTVEAKVPIKVTPCLSFSSPHSQQKKSIPLLISHGQPHSCALH
jgi:hypothetical protein